MIKLHPAIPQPTRHKSAGMRAWIDLIRSNWRRGFFFTLAQMCFRLAGEPAASQDLMLPLDEAELEELAALLARPGVGQGVVTELCALDGYLTCLLIGPESIMPGEWLNSLDLPASESDAEFERWLALLTRRMNMLAAQLHEGCDYRPIFETHPRFGQGSAAVDAWCRGFMTATVVRDAAWEHLAGHSDALWWLYPIRERANASLDARQRRSGKRIARRQPDKPMAFSLAQLKRSVLRIRAYWMGA